MLGMIPVIWTEEQDDSDCKSYYNLYTFIIFAGNNEDRATGFLKWTDFMYLVKQFVVSKLVVESGEKDISP